VYAKGAPPAAPPPPLAPPAPPYDYRSEMENQISATAPGARMQGGLLMGAASSGDYQDFPIVMDQGRCYTVIAIGNPKQVKELSVYIWGPNNKRITESRNSVHISSLAHCPAMTGSHKVQVKVASGKGEFAVGIYSK